MGETTKVYYGGGTAKRTLLLYYNYGIHERMEWNGILLFWQDEDDGFFSLSNQESSLFGVFSVGGKGARKGRGIFLGVSEERKVDEVAHVGHWETGAGRRIRGRVGRRREQADHACERARREEEAPD